MLANILVYSSKKRVILLISYTCQFIQSLLIFSLSLPHYPVLHFCLNYCLSPHLVAYKTEECKSA